jgi:hypothetical protein
MTDQEQELAKLRWALKTKENIIDRLQEAIRRLADQDATLSIEGGNVTVTMDATLTDEEREAIEWYANFPDGIHADTLRKLLERLTGPISGT